METKLNLGCGINHLDDFVNIDIDKKVHPDMVLNLGVDKLPFDDKSIIGVHGTQFLEHLYSHELVQLFDELKRVCKSGCRMYFVSPYMFCPAMGIIDHRHLISEYTFNNKLFRSWLNVKYNIKFGVFVYMLKDIIPIPYLLPSSIVFNLEVI